MPFIPDFFVLKKQQQLWVKRSSSLKDFIPESCDSVSYDYTTGDIRCFENGRVKYFCNNGSQLFPDIEFESIFQIYSKAYEADYEIPSAIIAKEPGKPMSVYSVDMSFENKENALLIGFVSEVENNSFKLLVLASKNGKTGLLDERGNIRIPFVFDSVIVIGPWLNQHSVNRMITFLDGKEGMVDFHNHLIHPAEYMIGSFSRNATYYDKGLFIVSKNTSSIQGLLDINGKEIIPFLEQTITEHTHNSPYKQHFFYVSRNGKKGVYDSDGIEIVPCEYYDVEDVNATKYNEKAPEFIKFDSAKSRSEYRR